MRTYSTVQSVVVKFVAGSLRHTSPPLAVAQAWLCSTPASERGIPTGTDRVVSPCQVIDADRSTPVTSIYALFAHCVTSTALRHRFVLDSVLHVNIHYGLGGFLSLAQARRDDPTTMEPLPIVHTFTWPVKVQ
ncbi:hypothetical protein J6590_052329 [Homalodisca vitripennis]|nr:hypothetical protein J6590_052329 [Homalodisca vitripennis]